jgi:hypothetical protein
MRQSFDKSALDWSRNKERKIVARGISAILTQRISTKEPTKFVSSTRCVWPTSTDSNDSRYLSRRVWLG